MNLGTDNMSILEALPVGVLIVDNSGDIRAINSAARALLGLGTSTVTQYESGVSKQEFIGLLDTNCRDDWARLLDTIGDAAGEERWHRITSAKASETN